MGLIGREANEHGMPERVTLWSRPCNGGAGCPHGREELVEVEYVRADTTQGAVEERDRYRLALRRINEGSHDPTGEADRALHPSGGGKRS